MKAPVSAAALGLLLALTACQPQPVPSQAVGRSVLPSAAGLSQSSGVPRATARLRQGQLQFVIDYPPPAPAGFQTQALNYPAFARFQVAIIGIGLAQPLYPAAADPDQNHTLAAACTASGCSVNAGISNVPSGQNRVALIVAYDAAGQVIPGASLAAAFDIPPDSSDDQTVRLSYLSTPVGQVLQQLLQQNLNLLAAELDASALQQFIVQLTGATGDFPAFDYTQLHPALINVPALVSDLVQNQGNVAALNPTNPDYVYAGGTVSGSVTGLLSGDSVRIRLSDPRTGAIAAQGNGNFSFAQVPPGEWQLLVEAPAGYSVSGLPERVTVSEGQTLSLDPITLTRSAPVIAGLASNTVSVGGNLVLTGSNFHNTPAENTITITGTLIQPGQFPIFGFWTVAASEVTEENGLQSVAFPLPPELAQGTWTNLKVNNDNNLAFNFTPFQVTSLSQRTALPGESVLINGVNFTGTAADYEVQIAGQVIPTANVTILSSQQIQVNLPPGLPLGETTVKLSKNGAAAELEPLLTLMQPISWSNSWGQLAATAAEHVLAIATATARPDLVWFGAKGDTGLGGIWRCESTAGNDSCSNILPAASVGAIQALVQAADTSPTQLGTFYAGSATAGVYACESQCQTAASWQQRNTGLGDLNVRALATDPQQPTHVYAATANGIYFSSDRGQTWSDFNAGLEVGQRNLHALAIYRPNLVTQPVLYVGTAGSGVFRKQGEASWATINTGIFSQDSTSNEGTQYLSSVTVSALRPHPANPAILYGGGTGQHQIITAIWKVGIWQRSETGGASNWSQIARNGSNGFPCPAGTFGLCNPVTPGTGLSSMQILDIAVDPANTSHIYTATRLDGVQTGGIYRSTDAGSSWASFSSFNSATVLGINQLRLYAGTPSGLYRAN